MNVLDIERIKNTFNIIKEDGEWINFKHDSGKQANIFPYVTSHFPKSSLDFKFILAEFFRLIFGKVLDQEHKPNEIINSVIKKVEVTNNREQLKEQLRDLINKLFFDDHSLEIFHPKAFNYIYIEKNKEPKRIANFLYNVLLNDKNRKNIYDMCNKESNDNILVKLMIDSMPCLETDDKQKNNKYKKCLSFIIDLFNKDLEFILSDDKFNKDYFEKLLKYYYFYYISQLSIHLSKMFTAKAGNELPYPIYFNLDWERSSKTRKSYEKGWRILDGVIEELFSHVNCLEFLNSRNDDKGVYLYAELKKEVINCMSDEKKDQFIEELNKLIKLYKDYHNKISWGKFPNKGDDINDSIEDKIKELFEVINFQFKNSSSTNEAYRRYKKRFKDFCKEEFLQPWGSLGNRLKLNQEYLIFFTNVCIGNKNKIRQNNLFKEFENRGLFFDKESKKRIINLYERLNILEKKSDSGDAQYVKEIL
ncbi:DNA phosphorothioation-dependent restriction protein DptG [Natroniella sulfidigena]|uniref:DNA phosphorothioation-dependent restriction protein DptG n=1 Tax=Natroniella sulfidigena TaxID=723921 RepID=UPI00200AE636|nr:DNA phosphorothioation-dependent restriction protein DptG [Natroniella sulfidigena]MCK8817152.1 DNA phosphorothioation-dependent restriction protein DptG [Natroniella sulfidigena]